MKNILQKRISLLFLVFSIYFCNLHDLNADSTFRTETIEFENQFSINIDIPDNWQIRRERGTPISGAVRTYDLIIIPPSNEKGFLRITVGLNGTRRPLPLQQFERLVESRVSMLLPFAVEEKAIYHNIQINNGTGKYCKLTDASLVNKTPDPDDYIYLGIYFANYNNGSIIYSTLLADEINNLIFQNMLRIVSSIIPLTGS
ncbi:MAG: hypothetical protein FWD47_10555 [Treponema sp.]|nr:hypothetical protein [Treponema sp.]